MWMSSAGRRTVVIGLGSPLMADDGVGIVALECLRGKWEPHPDVEFVDGGTWGMNILHVIEQADRVLFLDAIRNGHEPGTLVRLEMADLPRFLSTKVSPHQIDLREVLAVAELRGTLPPDTIALGVEPEAVVLSAALTPRIAAQVDAIVAAATAQLAAWGHTPKHIEAPAHA
jgi:hydrogenase maturation protease